MSSFGIERLEPVFQLPADWAYSNLAPMVTMAFAELRLGDHAGALKTLEEACEFIRTARDMATMVQCEIAEPKQDNWDEGGGLR